MVARSRLDNASDQPAAERKHLLLDRYRLDETIGHGGMATVYRAQDVLLDRTVAVKLLHPSVSREPRFVEQFLDMERHIARLFHPNLVTIYDAGSAQDGCYVVMEYVAGGSLRDLLARGEMLPLPEVVKVVGEVAGALHLLHAERIVHGDIKPDNVLLDERGDAKLVDFGIARLATSTLSFHSETLGGSIPYLAPEQLEHGTANARSDIYALGLVTYELLTGRKAYDGENWVAVAASRLARDPVPLAELRPDVPPELQRAVSRAIARDPNQRFSSAEELREAMLKLQSRQQASLDRAMGTGSTVVGAAAPADYADTAVIGGLAENSPTATRARKPDAAEPRPARRAARPAVSGAPRSTTPGSPLLLQILRGEHPLAVPLLLTAILVDVLLLVVILALFGLASGTPETSSPTGRVMTIFDSGVGLA